MKKIKTVTVTKLFGYEKNNYKIDFIQDNNITFIYALNGAGKTTVLRLIDAAIKRKMTVLDKINFETINIEFDSGEIYSVKKLYKEKFDELFMSQLPTNEEGRFYFPIIFCFKDMSGIAEAKYLFTEATSKEIKGLINQNSEARFLENGKMNRQILLSEFVYRPFVEEKMDNIEVDKKLLSIDVDLLFANKDYNRFVASSNSRVTKDNAKADSRVSYFENYESLDTIPFEMDYLKKIIERRPFEINTMSDISWNEFFLGQRTSSEYDNEVKFVNLNLPDKISYIEEQLKYFLTNEDDKIDLLNSLKTANRNFKPVDYIYKKIDLYEDIINEHNVLTDKKLKINKTTGLFEISTIFDDKELLPSKYLSSGEKNLLLLYFHLIFMVPNKCRKDSIFIEMIDEPEVSMHPDWLIRFVDNLKLINNQENVQFIITTHSPAITYANSQLMIEMKRY